MAKYRAQIIWDFDFDEKGITESEYEWRFDEELEELSRTPDEMMKYAKDELYEYISDYNTNLWDAIDVVLVEE